MAENTNTTAVFFSHQLDFSSSDLLMADLQNKLQAPVIVADFDDNFELSPEPPKGFEGWVWVTDQGDELEDFDPESMVELLQYHTGATLVFSDCFAQLIDDERLESFSWPQTYAFLSAKKEGHTADANSEALFNYVQDLAKQLGASELVMFNLEHHDAMMNNLFEGVDVEHALPAEGKQVSLATLDNLPESVNKWNGSVWVERI